MGWPGWRGFWFAASRSLQAGDKPAMLARAKEAIASLEERLDVMQRRAEIDDKYGDIDGRSTTRCVDPERDVLKEVEEAFGPNTAPKAGDKSL